jgi:hypothetical protein
LYGGGIICHLYKDSLGLEHGLIASLNDLTSGMNQVNWGVNNLVTNGLPLSYFDGESNTVLLFSSGVDINCPVNLCENYTTQGFNDWFLPSVSELEIIWGNVFILNSVLGSLTNADRIGFNVNGSQGIATQDRYWSSTLISEGPIPTLYVYVMGYYTNDLPNRMLSLTGLYYNNVRAIRKF